MHIQNGFENIAKTVEATSLGIHDSQSKKPKEIIIFPHFRALAKCTMLNAVAQVSTLHLSFQTLIFTETKRRADELTRRMRRDG